MGSVWLVIELGQGIKPTNIATKFYDDPFKNIQVTKQTRLILAILANQCHKLLYNEIIKVIERTNSLDAARRRHMCSHKKLMRRHQCSYSKCAKLQIIDTDKILTVKIQGKSAQNIGAMIQS